MKPFNSRLRILFRAALISVIFTCLSLTVSSFIYPNSGINTSPGCLNFCPVAPLTFSKLFGPYGPLSWFLLLIVFINLSVLICWGLILLGYIINPQKKGNGVINLITNILSIAVMIFGLYAIGYFLVNIF